MTFMLDLTNYASRINLKIKRSTHLQDHIQGGPKNWHTLFRTP